MKDEADGRAKAYTAAKHEADGRAQACTAVKKEANGRAQAHSAARNEAGRRPQAHSAARKEANGRGGAYSAARKEADGRARACNSARGDARRTADRFSGEMHAERQALREGFHHAITAARDRTRTFESLQAETRKVRGSFEQAAAHVEDAMAEADCQAIASRDMQAEYLGKLDDVGVRETKVQLKEEEQHKAGDVHQRLTETCVKFESLEQVLEAKTVTVLQKSLARKRRRVSNTSDEDSDEAMPDVVDAAASPGAVSAGTMSAGTTAAGTTTVGTPTAGTMATDAAMTNTTTADTAATNTRAAGTTAPGTTATTPTAAGASTPAVIGATARTPAIATTAGATEAAMPVAGTSPPAIITATTSAPAITTTTDTPTAGTTRAGTTTGTAAAHRSAQTDLQPVTEASIRLIPGYKRTKAYDGGRSHVTEIVCSYNADLVEKLAKWNGVALLARQGDRLHVLATSVLCQERLTRALGTSAALGHSLPRPSTSVRLSIDTDPPAGATLASDGVWRMNAELDPACRVYKPWATTYERCEALRFVAA